MQTLVLTNSVRAQVGALGVYRKRFLKKTILCWIGCAFFFLGVSPFVQAQLSNAKIETADDRGTPTADSILNNVAPNSRIGGYRYQGALKAGGASRSRFSSGVIYGSGGNFVGIDGNRSGTGRFHSGSRFSSKQDYSILKERNRTTSEENNLNDGSSPRLITATPPSRMPYATGRKARYGRTKEEMELERTMQVTESSAVSQGTIRETLPLNEPQAIWMRGRAPQTGASVGTSDTYGDTSGSEYIDNTYYEDPSAIDWNDPLSLGLGGSMTLNGETTDATIPMVPAVPSPVETQRAFQEYLEAQLLRSPDVNALSPIQVDFNDGVATVRGVVPTPTARAIAGNILLSDPRVQRVNNQLTHVYSDGQVGTEDSVPPANMNTVAPSSNNTGQ